MRRTLIALTMLIGGPVLAAPDGNPTATVSAAYEVEARSLAEAGGNAVAPWEGPHRGRFFTKRLARLFAKSKEGLGSDPFLSGQDGEIKNLALSMAGGNGETATVVARFKSFGSPVEVRFDLRREGGAWRIDDIHNTVDGQAYSVREQLSQD